MDKDIETSAQANDGTMEGKEQNAMSGLVFRIFAGLSASVSTPEEKIQWRRQCGDLLSMTLDEPDTALMVAVRNRVLWILRQ